MIETQEQYVEFLTRLYRALAINLENKCKILFNMTEMPALMAFCQQEVSRVKKNKNYYVYYLYYNSPRKPTINLGFTEEQLSEEFEKLISERFEYNI